VVHGHENEISTSLAGSAVCIAGRERERSSSHR
jgi:hypothetical protein